MALHFLAPPFHLPAGKDARLLRHLEDDDWASALTLLRDVVTPQTTEWKWLVLLAYVRFRDAADVMPDELSLACREALLLLERASEHGAPHDQVAPFREAVEGALDQLSRNEEALLGKLGPGDEPAALSDDELEEVAVILQRDQPLRAAKCFEALSARQKDSTLRYANQARAALARVAAGQFDAARPELEAALAQDWTQRPLSDHRLTLEAVETVLLEHASGAEFLALWQLATERGTALAFPFPAAWPHQERMLERLLSLRDFPRARSLAARIENERVEVPAALSERIKSMNVERV